MEGSNLKPFIVGVILCSVGAFLTFEMLTNTSWKTYSHSDSFEVEGEFGPVSYDYDTEMEIGLNEGSWVYNLEECDEDGRCYDLEIDEEFDLLDNPTLQENESIDCEDTDDESEYDLCEVDKAGSTAYSIITAGLGLLALTLLIASISVVGYTPGWVVTILSSISSVIILVGPIAWFVMMPDLNAPLEPSERKWVSSYAFYLTIISAPIIFLGGLVFVKMKAFGFDKDDDWDEDDYADEDEEYAEFSNSISNQNRKMPEREVHVDPNLQGVWGDDGYEWIEHPQGSETWYWRDQETGEWVRH